MLEYYSTEKAVSVNEVDASSNLSWFAIMQILQNLATSHADQNGYGRDNIVAKDNAFWVITKMRFKVTNLPKTNDVIKAETWPISPGKIVLERDFRLSLNGISFLEATSEWCLLDIDTLRPKRTAGTSVDNGNEYINERVETPAFIREKVEVSGLDFVYERIIRSSDIDVNGHTNNAKYTQMVTDAFSVDFLRQNRVAEYQITFNNQSYEGDALAIYKKQISEKHYYLTATLKDKTIFTVHIKFA